MISSRNDDSTISAKRQAVITANEAYDKALQQMEAIAQQQQEHPKALQRLEDEINAARNRIQKLEETDRVQIEKLEREINPLISWLRARPTHLLELYPFTPGKGTFQERIDALNIDIEIPPEFLGEYVKDEIDANGKALKYNKPVIMDMPVRVGKYTYEDLGQLREIAITKYGTTYVSKHFPNNWFNPCTGQKITEAATIDEDFLRAIESFVLIQEIAHHIHHIFVRQGEMLGQTLQDEALAAAKAIGNSTALPQIHAKTVQEIISSIANTKDHFPNFLHQQCVPVNQSPGLMTFPVNIKDGDSTWTLDFNELREHKRSLPAPKPHPKKYSVAQLKLIRKNAINRFILDKVRYIKNVKTFDYCYTRSEKLDPKAPDYLSKRHAEIKRIKDIFDPQIEHAKNKPLDEWKPEQIQQEAVSTHFYNPFLQEARWVRGLKIHTAALLQLDSILEEILIHSVDGFNERLQEIDQRKKKYAADVEAQKTDVIYTNELEMKRVNGLLEGLPDKLMEIERQLPQLRFELMLAKLELDKAEEDESASIDKRLHNGKRTFQGIIQEEKYPQHLLPENLPIQIKDKRTKVMTHPVLLDGEYVIDYADLMQHWQTQSYAFGLWQYRGKPGINPFTDQPVKEFGYAKKLRKEAKAFIKHIDQFKDLIQEHKAAQAKENPADPKSTNNCSQQEDTEENWLDHQRVIQEKLNALQELCITKEHIARPFSIFNFVGLAPQSAASFIMSQLDVSPNAKH